MYLIINKNTNVVEGSIELSTYKVSRDQTLLKIADEEYTHDMLGSIFVDVNNYTRHPKLDKTNNRMIDYYQSDGSVWVDLRKDDQVWGHVRAARNTELTSSDWTQMVDSPLSTPQISDWVVWRLALRTIPQDYTDPHDAENALNILVSNKPA